MKETSVATATPRTPLPPGGGGRSGKLFMCRGQISTSLAEGLADGNTLVWHKIEKCQL